MHGLVVTRRMLAVVVKDDYTASNIPQQGGVGAQRCLLYTKRTDIRDVYLYACLYVCNYIYIYIYVCMYVEGLKKNRNRYIYIYIYISFFDACISRQKDNQMIIMRLIDYSCAI